MAKTAKQGIPMRGLRALYIILSAVLTLATVVVCALFFFRLDEVVIHGLGSRYSEEQILQALDLDPQQNLLLLPQAELEEKLRSSFPYVREANLRLGFPMTLHVEISESIPVASILSAGAYYLLDGEGRVLEQVDQSIAAPYIRIDGLDAPELVVGDSLVAVEGSGQRVDSVRALLFAIEVAALQGEISWIDTSDVSDLEMDFAGRFTVQLPLVPTTDSLEDGIDLYERKIQILQETILMIEEGESGIIDLRLEDAYFRRR